MIFLRGGDNLASAPSKEFDVGDFWRIGALLIEEAITAHFQGLGFAVEDSHFEKVALRKELKSPDDAIELATGISFSARRPFRDDPYQFALAFNWQVRALFSETLATPSIARIALGMPVLYRPTQTFPRNLLFYRNRYLGRVRSIGDDGRAIVISRDDGEPQSVPCSDLRLEASPAVIKIFEQQVRGRSGPSSIIRRIQQLKMSYTRENRRNLTASQDRLNAIRSVLNQVGSSLDQLIVPLASFQPGSVSISLLPMEASFGDSW